MKTYKREFIQFAFEKEALLLGEFTLKSGRISPYFFNAGRFKTGKDIEKLGQFYASALQDFILPQNYDLLFGAAYKGIPLVTATAIALATTYQQDTPFCFNRKIPKQYGDGGSVVGESMCAKRILLIDDVVTAGTTIQETAGLIQKEQGIFIGVLIALDRKERGKTHCSAIQEAEKKYAIRIASIVDIDDLVEYLATTQQTEHSEHAERILDYRNQYGI
jgi:orotate phosphoribosyltransferase